MTAPVKPPAQRRHHCWNCGADMGVYDRRYCRSDDVCGSSECNRASRDAQQQERDEAHEALDRDMGFGW